MSHSNVQQLDIIRRDSRSRLQARSRHSTKLRAAEVGAACPEHVRRYMPVSIDEPAQRHRNSMNGGLPSDQMPRNSVDIYAYFLNRLRDNLHVVLSFSPCPRKCCAGLSLSTSTTAQIDCVQLLVWSSFSMQAIEAAEKPCMLMHALSCSP